jgi:hypothetical protein
MMIRISPMATRRAHEDDRETPKGSAAIDASDEATTPRKTAAHKGAAAAGDRPPAGRDQGQEGQRVSGIDEHHADVDQTPSAAGVSGRNSSRI